VLAVIRVNVARFALIGETPRKTSQRIRDNTDLLVQFEVSISLPAPLVGQDLDETLPLS
jgi:hypothetical protein